MFSNKKVENLRKQLSRGPIDPANTGLICKEHSEPPLSELQCKGYCGLVKPLASFSKNTRSNQEYACHQLDVFAGHFVLTL